jgi:hypothetical protein
MKIATDINQSKELVEILPKESADMDYIPITNIESDYNLEVNVWNNEHEEEWIPAWSLSALLNKINENYYTTLFHDGVAWNIDVIHHDDVKIKFNRHADYPVNACVEMIKKLKMENKL